MKLEAGITTGAALPAMVLELYNIYGGMKHV